MNIQPLKNAANWLMPNSETSTAKKIIVAIPIFLLYSVAKACEWTHSAFSYIRGSNPTTERTQKVSSQIFQMIGKSKTVQAPALSEPFITKTRDVNAEFTTFCKGLKKNKAIEFNEDEIATISGDSFFRYEGSDYMDRAKDQKSGFKQTFLSTDGILVFDQLKRDTDRLNFQILAGSEKIPFTSQKESGTSHKLERILTALLEKNPGQNKVIETAINTCQQAALVDFMTTCNSYLREHNMMLSQGRNESYVSIQVLEDGNLRITQKVTYDIKQSNGKDIGKKATLDMSYDVKGPNEKPFISDIKYKISVM